MDCRTPHLAAITKDHRRVNLKVFPFYAAYAVEGEVVWVLAVAHGYRRPGYWRERLAGR